jgi:predicted DNA-binding transcriptional regulator AlpA
MLMSVILLKIAEVCEALQVSEWTLYGWRKDDFGPKWLRLKGNDVRYPKRDLEKWIEGRTVSSLAEERGKGRTFPGSEAGGFS